MRRTPLKRTKTDSPAKKAFRKAKLHNVSWWKKKAWSAFSKWIRERDEYVCCTCGKQERGPGMHGGHFIPGRHNSVLFDEHNVHAQCYWCNMRLKGNPIKYFRFMQQKYGEAEIYRLEALDKQDKQFTVAELEAIYNRYKQPTL